MEKRLLSLDLLGLSPPRPPFFFKVPPAPCFIERKEDFFVTAPAGCRGPSGEARRPKIDTLAALDSSESRYSISVLKQYVPGFVA